MTTKPGASSIWLRIAAFYFKAGGVLFLIIAALGFFSGLALDWAPGTTQGMPFPLLIAIMVAMALSLLVTGILLGRRLRAGAVLGLVLTLYPLALSPIQGRSMGWLELGFIAVSAIVLLRVWRELEWRHTAAMILVVVFGVSCSPASRETQQHPDSSAPAEQSPPVKAVAGRYSLPDFARLRWLEERWRGRLPDGGRFFERYQFLDDSTIVMHAFPDSTLARATDSARITLRGGTVAHEGGSARWVATRLDPGYRSTKSLGVVRGVTVRSRSVFGTIGAAFQTLAGGNITLLTELCEKTREEAFGLVLEHAQQLGANAVVGFDTMRPK